VVAITANTAIIICNFFITCNFKIKI